MKKYVKPTTEIISADAMTFAQTWSLNGGMEPHEGYNPDDEILLWTSDQDALSKGGGWDLWP